MLALPPKSMPIMTNRGTPRMDTFECILAITLDSISGKLKKSLVCEQSKTQIRLSNQTARREASRVPFAPLASALNASRGSRRTVSPDSSFRRVIRTMGAMTRCKRPQRGRRASPYTELFIRESASVSRKNQIGYGAWVSIVTVALREITDGPSVSCGWAPSPPQSPRMIRRFGSELSHSCFIDL